MSEGRNPISYVFDTEDGLNVALLEGQPKTRRELEGLPPDTMVVTMVLENPYDDEPMAGWRRTLYDERGRYTGHEPFEIDTSVLSFMGCNDTDRVEPEGEPVEPYTECGRPAVAILNGISGPGFAMECEKHVVQWQQSAQIWRPIKLTIEELDEVLTEGLAPSYVNWNRRFEIALEEGEARRKGA